MVMQTYIVRRSRLVATAAKLNESLTRLRDFEDIPQALEARWIRSYVSRDSGRFCLACVFQAGSAQTLRQHAQLTELPAHEVLPVVATIHARSFAPSLVYLIRRRSFCGNSPELEQRLSAAKRVAEEMSREVSWLRTYAVREQDNTLGTVCFYQGVNAQALREHASRVGIPADEIEPVIGRVVFRTDPYEHSDFGVTVSA